MIATALPAIGSMNENEIPTTFVMCGNSLSHSIIKHTNTLNSRGALFMQLPRDPGDPNKDCYTSDSGTYVFKVYEDFWNVTNPIHVIYWWGFSMWFDFGWVSCDPVGMNFDIIFYEDDGGVPGAEVCSYVDITYSVNGTGIMYEWLGGNLHEMLYYEAQLDPCCNLSAGWVSIQSTYSPNGCSFLWMNSADGNNNAYQYKPPLTQLSDDLAFILTDGEPDMPDLECDGSLSWTDVKPGSIVNGNFTVRNIGGPGSLLDWKIDEYPIWGIWDFRPEEGENLTLEDGPVTIEVTVVAPDENNSEFTGEVKIINKDNSSDFCTIDVSLATPKNKAFNFNFYLLERLFERFPNAFLIVRQLLGL